MKPLAACFLVFCLSYNLQKCYALDCIECKGDTESECSHAPHQEASFECEYNPCFQAYLVDDDGQEYVSRGCLFEDNGVAGPCRYLEKQGYTVKACSDCDHEDDCNDTPDFWKNT